MNLTRRGSQAVAAAAAAVLVLAACGGDADEDPGADEPGADEPMDEPEDIAVVYAGEQEFASYNNSTADQNARRNVEVLNGVVGSFYTLGPDGFAVRNEDYGTYELISEDPQIVEYTYHPDAAWSDGTPLGCADWLLYWAANSGHYEHPTATDDEGNPTTLFSTAGTAGVEDWVKPDCQDGDQTIQIEYEVVYADWEVDSGRPGDRMPAHIVAEQGGLTTEELIQAIRDDDIDALLDAAEFYNNGWIMNPGELLPAELIPSSGPYNLVEWVAGESVTLEYNEGYWGEPPAARSIVHRFFAQDQMAQALDNREVEVIDPQPNPDLANQLTGMAGVVVEPGESFTYEHLDFNMASGHYFEDRELREAFAKCVPRALIVENLIHPLKPDAAVLDARLTYSFMPDYGDQVEGSGAENYAEPDIDGARQILEDLDAVGTEVRIGYQNNPPNPRRTNTVELIRDSCNEAGFEIIDSGMDPFFGGGLDQGDFDVALFGWVGSAYVSGTSSTFTTAPACAAGQKGNNNGCYSNPDVDDLYRQLLSELDIDAQRVIVKQIEAILWEDLPTIPLFTFTSIPAWADDLQGVVDNQTQDTLTVHKHGWSRL
jgi:peptide/nickel transport system substrate-binding protein